MLELRRVLTLVLAGGAGSRLHPLTRVRAKPAVPFGGKYRIIDFTLSNCINSGLRQIMVLSQYKSHSLDRHIREAWGFLSGVLGEFVYSIPPQQRVGINWYLGTGDAVFQNLYSISMTDPEYVLVLSGDHIYKMDYRNMLNYHLLSGADATIGVLEVDRSQASSFGVVQVGRENEITGFVEKPNDPEVLASLPDQVLISMGIYVFRADVLVDILRDDAGDESSSHDFGKDIIPRMVKESKRVFSYPFREKEHNDKPYWRDVGTLDAYYEANMDLVSVLPSLNLYDADWPFRTVPFRIPPAKFVFNETWENRIGYAINSIVCDGCIISGGQVYNSVLSTRVRINSFADIRDSIIMSGVNIGRHSLIKKAIIDKNVDIPPYTVIGYDLEEDSKRYTVTESGITVIPKDAVIE